MNTPKIAIFRMCYRENGTVKFLETLTDNVCTHNYLMMQIKKKIELWEHFGVTQAYTLKFLSNVNHYILIQNTNSTVLTHELQICLFIKLIHNNFDICNTCTVNVAEISTV